MGAVWILFMTQERRKNLSKRKTVDAVLQTARADDSLSLDELLRQLSSHEAAGKAFREKEQQFRALIENIPGALYRRELDGDAKPLARPGTDALQSLELYWYGIHDS